MKNRWPDPVAGDRSPVFVSLPVPWQDEANSIATHNPTFSSTSPAGHPSTSEVRPKILKHNAIRLLGLDTTDS
jgi:hypothetical protein